MEFHKLHEICRKFSLFDARMLRNGEKKNSTIVEGDDGKQQFHYLILTYKYLRQLMLDMRGKGAFL